MGRAAPLALEPIKLACRGTKGRNQSSSGIKVPTIRGNSVVSISGKRSGRLGAVASSPATSRQTPHPATPTAPSSVSPSTSHSRPSSNSGPSPSRSMVSQDGLSRYNIN